MTGRLARDDEVAAWQRDGWVLLDGLVGTDVIDAAVEELWQRLPAAGGVSRRPRRGDREVARSTGGTARRVRLARDRPRLPARAAPVARRVPLSRAAPQPLVRAARGRRLHDRARCSRPTSASTKRSARPSTRARRTSSNPCTRIGTTRGCRRGWNRRGGTSNRSSTCRTSTRERRRRTSWRSPTRPAGPRPSR